LYGPDDDELLAHIRNGHKDFDFVSLSGTHFVIPGAIPKPYNTTANLNENSPAN
jgi:hypothetical protein